MSGLLISIVVPFLGLLIFSILVLVMNRKEIERPPVAEFFWLFVFYGGTLLAVLTELYWEWIPAAIAGTFVLVFVGPFFLILLAYRLWKLRKESIFHMVAFVLCLLYPLSLVALGVIAWK